MSVGVIVQGPKPRKSSEVGYTLWSKDRGFARKYDKPFTEAGSVTLC